MKRLYLPVTIFIVLVLASVLFVLPWRQQANDLSHAYTDCKKLSGAIDAMVWIEPGDFDFGNNQAYRDEATQHRVFVDGFWISHHEVSNQEYAEFVEATGYVTIAEQYLDPETYPDLPDEQRGPGSVVFVSPGSESGAMTSWWQFVSGANWRHPQGPDSDIAGKAHHPVVHIAYQDAVAYADWKGHELPTEKQWEYAAKGNGSPTVYAWGEEFAPGNQYRANTWQGVFPFSNSSDDGYVGTAPIGCYPANQNGLYDMIGNIWEWTSSWYEPGHQLNLDAPGGYDPGQPGVPVRVVKGGSFLCAANFCRRYRPSARHAQDVSFGTSHIGFRTVINDKKGS